MSKVSTILVFLTLYHCVELYAQNQKIGFIDSNEVIEQMPEYSGVEQRLNLLSESWRDEIQDFEDEISRLETEFEAREILYTDEMRENRLEEINELAEKRDSYLHEKFGPEGEYFQRQRELLEPIQRQIFEAVYRVADRYDYDFVFDRAEDVRFLYSGSEWNLTEDVMTELGILEGN